MIIKRFLSIIKSLSIRPARPTPVVPPILSPIIAEEVVAKEMSETASVAAEPIRKAPRTRSKVTKRRKRTKLTSRKIKVPKKRIASRSKK